MTQDEQFATSEKIKAMLHEYFHRAYTLGDATVIDELLAPDILTYGLSAEPTRTRQDFKNWYTPFRSSFSDVNCQMTHCVVEGEWVSCRVHFTGTHTGKGLGPPPTGNKVILTAMVLARVRNGQVVEGYNEFNQHSLLQQIGAL